MKIIYNIEKLKQEAKRLKDLSFDEECSYEKSVELQKQAKVLLDKIYFITMLRQQAGKERNEENEKQTHPVL